MNRLILAAVIVSTGLCLLCGLSMGAGRMGRDLSARRASLLPEKQSLLEARAEAVALSEHLHELKIKLQACPPSPHPASAALAHVMAHPGTRLSPEQSEELLAELGFDWNNSGDFVVVSKDALHTLRIDAMNGMKLTEDVRDVLAITPAERGLVEAVMQQVAADYSQWARSHLQREDNGGDVVAKYTLPVNPELSQRLGDAFTSGTAAALGTERGGLLKEFGWQWMTEHGMNNSEPVTMIVTRSGSGNGNQYGLEVRQGGSTMTTEVSPWQFPEAFRPAFPGGWPDVAAREGFELPKEFTK